MKKRWLFFLLITFQGIYPTRTTTPLLIKNLTNYRLQIYINRERRSVVCAGDTTWITQNPRWVEAINHDLLTVIQQGLVQDKNPFDNKVKK